LKAQRRLDDARSYCSVKQYEQCVKAYEDAINLKPEIINEIQNEYKIALGEFYLESGNDLIEKGIFDKGIENCKKVLNLENPEHNLRAKDCITKGYIKSGDRAIENKEWKKAKEYFENALNFNPEIRKSIENKLKLAKSWLAKAANYYKKGEAELKAGRYESALENFDKAYQIDPDEQKTKAINLTKEALTKRQCQYGMDVIKKGQFGKAIEYFESGRKWANLPCIEQGIRTAYFERARFNEKVGKYAQAAADYIRAGNYRELERMLKKVFDYKIGIVLSKNHSDYAIVANTLIKNGLGPFVLVGESGIRNTKVNFIILAELSGFNIEVEQLPQTLSKQYQCGTRVESNPEYYRLQREVENLRRKIDDLERRAEEYEQRSREASERCHAGGLGNAITYCTDLSGVQASSLRMEAGSQKVALAMMESELNNTSPTREVPVYCQWGYQKVDVRKTIDGGISYSIIEPTKDITLKDGLVNHRLIKSDSFIENPNPDIGIWEDSLELPSDVELKELFIGELVGKFSREIIPILRKITIDDIVKRANPKNCANELLKLIYIGNIEGTCGIDIELPDKLKYCIPKEDLQIIVDSLGACG
jgi:tetratricopeptide (TPR) repeat protein